jgi:biopolymer transport protein ExbD
MAGGGAPSEEAGPKRNVFGETLPQSVELNLTALMDILSNLLFFLLASFGATIVMSINGTVPVQSADKSDVAENKEQVTVNLRLTKEAIEVEAAGTAQSEAELAAYKIVIPHVAGHPDGKALSDHLARIKAAYPKSDTVLLTPEPGLTYATMIQVMDAARERAEAPGKPPSRLFPTVVVSTLVK